MKKEDLTAYHKWLLNREPDDRLEIFYDNVMDKNPQAWDLLEQTGDQEFTADTFIKALKIIEEAI